VRHNREPGFIYFDLGNVLLKFSHRLAARQMADVAGVTEEMAWNAVFESGLSDRYELGHITSRDFFEHFCRATSSRPDFQQLLHAVSDIFELNTAIVPLVTHLHSAHRRLGILSNTNEAHWQFVSQGRYAIIRDFFPVKALSFQLKSMKPQPEIYTAAAALAGFDPQEIFFMDDRTENVAGARAVGFDAVLYENPRQLADELRRRHVRWNY
jgi:putative hydrolase of the HAD superfamily